VAPQSKSTLTICSSSLFSKAILTIYLLPFLVSGSFGPLGLAATCEVLSFKARDDSRVCRILLISDSTALGSLAEDLFTPLIITSQTRGSLGGSENILSSPN
jgi:hypothetical protein